MPSEALVNKRKELRQLRYDLRVLNLYGGNNPDLDIALAKMKLESQIASLLAAKTE